jgi:hypothetical protein
MVRLMIASIVGAIGYLLVFAGVAERGRWALRPWDALSQATNVPGAADQGAAGSSSGGGGSGIVGTLESVGSKIWGLVP